MGNIVEGGGINTGYTRSTVANSPAVSGSVARNILGINAYDNRTQNYYSQGDMFTGSNGMGAGGLEDLLLLALLKDLKSGDKCDHLHKKAKKCQHEHNPKSDKLEDGVRKNYELQTPSNRVGELLNQMRTNKGFLNDLRAATPRTFMGFGKQLSKEDITRIANHHFGQQGYDPSEIEYASNLLVENNRHKHDDSSKWAWGLGIPLAIAGGLALPAVVGSLVAGGIASGGAAALAGAGLTSGAAAAGAATIPLATAWGSTLAIGAVGATAGGAVGAMVGNNVDDHGDKDLSGEDINKMASDFDETHLNQEEAVNYYKDIHYGKKHDAYKSKDSGQGHGKKDHEHGDCGCGSH